MSLDELNKGTWTKDRHESARQWANRVRWSGCSMCGDSTFDHECNERKLDPSDEQRDMLDALAEIARLQALLADAVSECNGYTGRLSGELLSAMKSALAAEGKSSP